MDPALQSVLQAKVERRRKLERLPLKEKAELTEALRDAEEIREGKRQNAPEPEPPRAGGQATAAGVNYEVRIAAYLAVKMLAGARAQVWDGITGADLAAITMQSRTAVDDIVVKLTGADHAAAYVSAKKRGKSLSLTSKDATFRETIAAFVRQFRAWTPTQRERSRLVWAAPSWASRSVLVKLATELNEHRQGRQRGATLEKFAQQAVNEWERQSRTEPAEGILSAFLARCFVQQYDFEIGGQLELSAIETIATHLVEDPARAERCWETLENLFHRVNEHGLPVTPETLRKQLVDREIALKAPPDFAADIRRLQEVSRSHLARLNEFDSLRFGPGAGDRLHIPRTLAVEALAAAVGKGHLLLTGEPGIGKSGLLHSLVQSMPVSTPRICLLAERLTSRDDLGSANLPGLSRSLPEVLANWQPAGLLVIDAMDAVRDSGQSEALLELISRIRNGESGWTVLASVREYDLRCGRRLKQAFPGQGVPEYSSSEFNGIAHFHLSGFADAELAELIGHRTELRDFVLQVKDRPQIEPLVRSPFYLALAAELLRYGIRPEQLADWETPSALFRKYWEVRILDEPGRDEREAAMTAICQGMAAARTTTCSRATLRGHAKAIEDLCKRGVLASPLIRFGTPVGSGDDVLQFRHHLLYDYAIARTLIPRTPEGLVRFAVSEPLFPIFFRPSFLFALEELWDTDPDESRPPFWNAALQLERTAGVHEVTKLIAPRLAARRTTCEADLRSVLEAVAAQPERDSPERRLIHHVVVGLLDTDPSLVRRAGVVWSRFAERMSELMERGGVDLEASLIHLLNKLNEVHAG